MTEPLQIVFMGTPEFAVPSLDALVGAGHRVVAVYTRQDKPAGRGREPTQSPVKRYAVAAGIPVEQPGSLRTPKAPEQLASYAPDLLVVAAYGLILPKSILDAPRLGPVNVHPSLLPRHRGPAPIAGAILAGDAETGVSIMLMDEGVDTGPILSQSVVPLDGAETTGSLTDRLAAVGAELLAATVSRWVASEIQPRPQDDSLATFTQQFSKADGMIDWEQPATTLARRIRALQPWPGAFTFWNGRLLKVLRARPLDVTGSSPVGTSDRQPGDVLAGLNASPIVVVTGAGLLAIDEVQLEGKRSLPAAEFRRGQPIDGAHLG